MLRAYIVKEVASLCKEMDMKKTVSTDSELEFIVRTILDDFPALKVEEIKISFDRIRKGEMKLYERLKGPEILLALKEHEALVRAPILEDLHRREKQGGRMQELPDWCSRMKEWLPEESESAAIGGHGIGSRLRKQLDVKEEGKQKRSQEKG